MTQLALNTSEMGESQTVSACRSFEPATGALLWTGPAGDVDAEVARVRAGWIDWAARPTAFRIETLRRFANGVRARHAEFSDLIARETGKPLWEAQGEIDGVIAKVDISVSAYTERTGPRRLEGALGIRSALRHKPHGVLGVLGPCNSPALLPAGHIIPALLAGNGIVFKPSEHTPASGSLLVACLHEAGVPANAVRLLIGGAAAGKRLSAHPGIDGILFTGSTRNGMALYRQFSETPNRLLALEMGGNNPIVVWDAPDAQQAAVIVVQSAFMSAGQQCTAARRLIVQEGREDLLIAEICKLIDRMIIDEPHATPAPFMGPLISQEAADTIVQGFLDLMMKGAHPIRHMARPIAGRPFLTPGIIDVTHAQRTPDEEYFGPLLQLIRVPDFDSALAEANATRFGLAASLIGGSPALYDRFWANTRAGLVNWNRPTNVIMSSAPFGGVGLSGNHRPGAYYTADYCAYPVVSTEVENARAAIGIGLRDAAGSY